MSERPLFDPRDFIIADGIAHLCAGGESACLHRHSPDAKSELAAARRTLDA